MIAIERIPAESGEEHEATFAAIAEIERAAQLDLLGHDDLAEEADVLRIAYADQADKQKVLLTARIDDRIVGTALLRLPIHDNRDLAELNVTVHPQWRGQGVEAALAGAMEDIARDAGRARVVVYEAHAEAPEGDETALVPPTGVGRIPADHPAVAFWRERGYRLEQAERHSTQPLPMDAAVQTQLTEQAAARSDGYRLISFVGECPPEYLDGVAALYAGISTDAPMGELDLEEEAWDADRVRRADARTERLGYTQLTTLAQHEATGELVAFTQLDGAPNKPEVGYQGETQVQPEHRGHRLGYAVKLANIALAAEALPQLRRVHTWNAGENEWMLAINIAMGYRPQALESVWSRKL